MVILIELKNMMTGRHLQHCVLLHPRQGVQRHRAVDLLRRLPPAEHGGPPHLRRLRQEVAVRQEVAEPRCPLRIARHHSAKIKNKTKIKIPVFCLKFQHFL